MTLTAALILVHMALHALEVQLRRRGKIKAADTVETVDEMVPDEAPKSKKAPVGIVTLCLCLGALSFACTPTELAAEKAGLQNVIRAAEKDGKGAADLGADVCELAPALLALQPKVVQDVCEVLVHAKPLIDALPSAPSASSAPKVGK